MWVLHFQEKLLHFTPTDHFIKWAPSWTPSDERSCRFLFIPHVVSKNFVSSSFCVQLRECQNMNPCRASESAGPRQYRAQFWVIRPNSGLLLDARHRPSSPIKSVLLSRDEWTGEIVNRRVVTRPRSTRSAEFVSLFAILHHLTGKKFAPTNWFELFHQPESINFDKYRGVGIPRTGIHRTPLEFPGQTFTC